MKKVRWIVFILCLGIFIKGLGTTRHFPLSQPETQISKIELLHKQMENNNLLPLFVPICEIPMDQVDEFLSDFQQLDCSRNGFDPATAFGELVIRITYQNGDADLVGYANNAYVTAEGIEYDIYRFNSKEFKFFFAQYAGDTMPEDAMAWIE